MQLAQTMRDSVEIVGYWQNIHVSLKYLQLAQVMCISVAIVAISSDYVYFS